MSTQNDWLSTYFGDEVADDLEKTAQARLLVKLAEQNGLDINQFSEEELQQLAAELMAELEAQQGGQPGAGVPGQQPGGPVPGAAPQAAPHAGVPNPMIAQQQMQRPQAAAPQAAPQAAPAPAGPTMSGGLSPEMAKEAQAKFEEADALGRVMAHAYVEELDKIASARNSELEKTAGRGAAVAAKAKDVAGRAANFAKGNKKAIGAAAGGAAAGFAAGRMSKKASSAAFEKLANDRAVQILQTLGIDPATGQPMQPEAQDQAPQEPDFDQAVDARALQILADAGFDPNAVAQAYDSTVGGGDVPQQ